MHAITTRSRLLLPAEREHLEDVPVRQLERLALAALVDLPELADRQLVLLVAAVAARLGGALARLLEHHLITLQLLARSNLLRASFSATTACRATGRGRRVVIAKTLQSTTITVAPTA